MVGVPAKGEVSVMAGWFVRENPGISSLCGRLQEARINEIDKNSEIKREIIFLVVVYGFKMDEKDARVFG
jgi:hypothetical protein